MVSPDQSFNDKVFYALNKIHALLVSKNKAYGNSALEPSRIFSKADSIEQLKVSIDHKLTRIKNQGFDDSEDTLNDLIGYLVLLKIALNEKNGIELDGEDKFKEWREISPLPIELVDSAFGDISRTFTEIIEKADFATAKGIN